VGGVGLLAVKGFDSGRGDIGPNDEEEMTFGMGLVAEFEPEAGLRVTEVGWITPFPPQLLTSQDQLHIWLRSS
jgi:hypothetical protein